MKGNLQKLVDNMEDAFASKVTYGINEAQGSKEKQGADANVASVAFYNEFGAEIIRDGETIIIPPRPAFQRSYGVSASEYRAFVRNAIKKMIRGEYDAEKALSFIGKGGAEVIRQEIMTSPSWAEPNSPKTIAKKGHDHPLIDTGEMVESLGFSIDGAIEVEETI